MRSFLVILLLCVLCPKLAAQQVVGVLTSADDQTPVPGAVVTLHDPQGTIRAGTLSNQQGRYTLPAVPAGRYRLKIDRIGFASFTSADFEVAERQIVVQNFALATSAIELTGITAQGTSRCRARPESGVETYRLWEEARKALTAVAITEAQRIVSFHIRTTERDLHPQTDRVVREKPTEQLIRNEYPFRSAPAEELMQHGFVRPQPDTTVYHAPDAHLLLSDAFLDGHCFSVRRDRRRAGQIGLAFAPVPARRHLYGVAGVLWLDEQTAELRQLEYHYTRLPLPAERERYGGKLNFERLENGAWIVRNWLIRAPRLVIEQQHHVQRSRAQIAAHETAGEVVAVGVPDRLAQTEAVTGSIAGSVLDDETGEPIEGAVVYLSGTPHETTTDAAGEFRFPELRQGQYLVSAYRPGQVIAGDLLPTCEIRLGGGESLSLELRLPGIAAQMAARCAGRTAASGAVVAGQVRDRATGIALGSARIELRPAAGRGAVLHAVTDAAGRYSFCNVPRGGDYRARAILGTHRSVEHELRVPAAAEAPPLRSDFSIDLRTPLGLVGRILEGTGGGYGVIALRTRRQP